MDSKQRKIDKQLVLEYQSGNKKALVFLVKRWHKLFCEKAFYILKDADTAKDVTQDCWNVIMDKICDLKNPESFGSWGMRIVYTKSLDTIKAKNRSRNVLESYKEEQGLTDVEEENREQLKMMLLKAIKELPQNQHTVIKLFYVEDYSLKEISDILNISVGTAKSRLFNAREKLKLILKNKNYEK
ncbi:sigma-70 family RNA polymerase sigma factor [Flavivirga aquimarina]|uniref:Sigma-70 family RNA polymerase sigma factor n=1 Tax=Flavivirga aquimarina TaxID=2027862 RepID=A0ABT8WFP5_9FLAO|nr:sigma-70 family RNA polymerase sigma factor [Flavivirga aquimarina]MDO5971831.1 sigma-70 family RNA polymerase sigma factor [Flavivirga aquimarina]